MIIQLPWYWLIVIPRLDDYNSLYNHQPTTIYHLYHPLTSHIESQNEYISPICIYIYIKIHPPNIIPLLSQDTPISGIEPNFPPKVHTVPLTQAVTGLRFLQQVRWLTLKEAVVPAEVSTSRKGPQVVNELNKENILYTTMYIYTLDRYIYIYVH